MANFTRDPWQDPMVRFTTVPAAKTLEASEVFQGFIGSWAAEYVVHNAMMDDISTPENGMPAQPRTISSHLGHPGFPEINFVPYAHGTNRFGPKGGALLGCPVSFSIVGPTLKRGHRVNWQWVVTDNSATPGVGDTLTLDDYVIDFSASPPAEVSIGVYNLWNLYQISDISSFPGGLYVVITHPGSKGSLTEGGVLVDGGIGTGSIWEFTTDGDTRGPLSPNSESSLYEIFRVIDISGSTLTLDPNKRLADYYTFPVGVDRAVVRGITLMEPKAARLVAIQDGVAAGDETTFVIVPPDRAANDDQQYPWMTLPINGGWHDSAFQEDAWNTPLAVTDGTCDTDLEFEYLNQPQLPVPKPVGQGTFRLWGVSGEGVAPDVGPGRMWLILDDPSNIKWGNAPNVGDIIHIYNVKQVGDVVLADPNPPTPTLENILGWYEVVRIPFAGKYVVRRVDDVDPNTGRPFYGTAMLLAMYSTGTAAGERIELEATIHKPIPSLWNTSTYDIDSIDSARLTNIIDPSWVGHSLKGQGNSLLARADRAIFDTAYDPEADAYANPGSLLDLGFRMVFFPAKTRRIDIPNPITGGIPPWSDPLRTVEVLVPDFDHPIDSHEVLLDPSKPNEKQWIDVDYSNGIVRLSHAVRSGSPFYNPAIFTAEDNPRRTMVLFASFVPYSREPGQLGSGIRVAGGAPVNELDVPCQPQGTEHESADVYGSRNVLRLAPGVTNTIDNTRGDPTYSILINGNEDTLRTIPASGFVEVLTGASADGNPEFLTTEHRGTLFGYYAAAIDNVDMGIRLYGWYGGGTAADGSFSYDANTRGVAVLRKDVTLPNAPDGVAGTPFQYDTTYGHAKRSGTVRFGDAELRHNADGSISVTPRNTIAKSIQDGLKFTLGYANLLDGGEITVVAEDATTVTLGFTGITYTYHGETHVHGPAELVIPKEASPILQYLWWDGKPGRCELSSQIDLPVADEFLLLAKADIPAAPTVGTVLTDLRYPLKDFDERTDVFVGVIPAPDRKRTPWFPTLAKAVAYCSELMNPAAGDPGKGMRIRVVSPTVETETPIVIKTDGLTIEGAGVREDSPVGLISWDSDGPLIDINGHNNITVRNLRSVNTNPIPACVADITVTGVNTSLVDVIQVHTLEPQSVYVTVDLAPAQTISIPVGGTTQLTATTTGGPPETYSWLASNASATVSGGLVTGVSPGSVYITAVGDVTKKVGTFLIRVHDGSTHAVLVGGQTFVKDGVTSKLYAETVNGAGDPGGYTWVSGNTGVVTLTSPGTFSTLTSIPEEPRSMFVNTGGISSGVTIDNCGIINTVSNPHNHGFLYIRGNSGLKDSRIINNKAHVTDFGIYVVGTTGSSMEHVEIHGNDFVNTLVTDREYGWRIKDLGGGIRVSVDTSTDIHIDMNSVQNFSLILQTAEVFASGDTVSDVPTHLSNNTYGGTNSFYVSVGINSVVTGNRFTSYGGGVLDVGINSSVEANIISTTSGSTTTIAGGTRLSGNVVEGLIVKKNCKIDGNHIDKGLLISSDEHTGTIVTGNYIGEVSSTGYSVVVTGTINNAVFDGNSMKKGFHNPYDESTFTATGNTFGGVVTITGYDYTFADNIVFGAAVLGVRSSSGSASIVGNEFRSGLAVPAPSQNIRIGNNTITGNLTLTGGDGSHTTHTIVGNRVTGDAIVEVANSTIGNNIVDGSMNVGDLLTSPLDLITGNRIGTNLVSGPGCHLTGNYVMGTTTAGNGSFLTGNFLSGQVTVGTDCIVTGNGFGVGLTAGSRCLISGNNVALDIDITGSTGCSVIGNSFTNLLPAAGDPDPVTPVIGNRVVPGGKIFGASPGGGSILGNH